MRLTCSTTKINSLAVAVVRINSEYKIKVRLLRICRASYTPRPFLERMTEVCTNTRIELSICVFTAFTTTGRSWRANGWFLTSCSMLSGLSRAVFLDNWKLLTHILELNLLISWSWYTFQHGKPKHFMVLTRFSRYHKPLNWNQFQ